MVFLLGKLQFKTASGYYFYNEGKEYLSAGVMEIKGNFNSEGGVGNYRATGRHKVILSGESEQVVSHTTGVTFNELEIKNATGVRFEMPIALGTMKGNYKVIGELVLDHINGPIAGDVTVDGDLRIMNGVLDLAGHKLVVTKNFVQATGFIGTTVKINKGCLKVNGNYTIGYGSENNQIYSIIEMVNDEDYVYVGGNFKTTSGYNYNNEGKEYLTAGVMEIKGNINSEGGVGNYRATGRHKVILSGDGEQVVSHTTGVTFNELEIKNATGVRFEMPIALGTMKGNYKVIGELVLDHINGPIAGDVTVDGDLRIMNGVLDLAGHKFVVTKNFVQTTGAIGTTVKINKGYLKVNGNYTIGYGPENNNIYSVLEMTNDADYVYVGGNFKTTSGYDHSRSLTAGTLEVKANFTQSNITASAANFAASGTHQVILSGTEVQKVTFESPGMSRFNILKITKPLETGYIFNITPVWNTLKK